MPSVPETILRNFDPKQDGNLRLASQANVAKPQACHACQQRKRKCDKRRPTCGMCEKRKIDCVYDVKITDRSHPNFLTDLLSALEEKDKRIKALESLISARLPDLARLDTLSVDDIVALAAAVHPPALIPSPAHSLPPPPPPPPPRRAAHPLVAGFGSAPMSPPLLASVRERIFKVDLTSSARKPISVVTYMHAQLGGDDDAQPEDPRHEVTNVASWPPYELAVQVVKAYVNCNAMYPMFRLRDLLINLEEIYQPSSQNPGNPEDRATPLQTFNFFLIFSIGFVWLARQTRNETIDTSLLRNRAISCLDDVLKTEPAISCVSSLFLMSFWAVFDCGGPDLVFLHPIITELALELGLHKEPLPELPEEEKDRRRILFWSIFCQERAGAGVLPVPVTIQDEDITVGMPAHLDPIGTLAEGLDPNAFYRHNIAMRRIFYEVNLYVHCPEPTVADRIALQRRLDEWYIKTPRPPPPHDTMKDGFFDLYYHTIRANLYRPRSLQALPIEHITILKDSASTAMSIAVNLYEQRKYVDNYYHLYNAMSMGLTMLYTLILAAKSNPDTTRDPEWQAAALVVISRCQMVVGTFCRGWPYARGLSRAFDALAARVASNLMGGEHALLSKSVDAAASGVEHLSIAGKEMPLTLNLFPRQNDPGWNTWLNGSIGPLSLDSHPAQQSLEHAHHQPMEVSDALELENLMSSMGWMPEWPTDMDLGIDMVLPEHT